MAGMKKGSSTGGKKKGSAAGGKTVTMKQRMAKLRAMKKPKRRA
tara:strand:- start:264 stop:395 length:132 start_codon:yes stop_codon:yes gene_type:complete